jgi:hypothetical protein
MVCDQVVSSNFARELERENRRMVEALKLFRDCEGSFGENIREIAASALPMSETRPGKTA